MAVVGQESTLNYVVDFIALIGIVGIFYLQGKLNNYKRHGHLLTILDECMKKQRPLGFIVDKSGTMIPFCVEPEESKIGLAKNPGKYVLLSPDLVKPSAKMELHRGPKVLIYTLPYFFPQSVQSAAALSQLVEKIHKHERLSVFRNDIKIAELLFNNSATFGNDCKTFVATQLGKIQLPDSYYIPAEEEVLTKSKVIPKEEEEEQEEEEEEEIEETEDIEENAQEEPEEETDTTEKQIGKQPSLLESMRRRRK